MTHVGRSVRRVEDARLLRGAGRFVDDVDRAGQLWMRVVRSPNAHAELRGIDTAAAREIDGVCAVVTAADLGDPPPHIPVRLETADAPLGDCLQPVLATALLRENPDPTDDEIREAMASNICRCTGYQSILEAVKAAASA